MLWGNILVKICKEMLMECKECNKINNHTIQILQCRWVAVLALTINLEINILLSKTSSNNQVLIQVCHQDSSNQDLATRIRCLQVLIPTHRPLNKCKVAQASSHLAILECTLQLEVVASI